jgi:hypothetical protein
MAVIAARQSQIGEQPRRALIEHLRAAILALCKSRLFASMLVLVSGRVIQNMRCTSKDPTNFKSLASISSATSALSKESREAKEPALSFRNQDTSRRGCFPSRAPV